MISSFEKRDDTKKKEYIFRFRLGEQEENEVDNIIRNINKIKKLNSKAYPVSRYKKIIV